MAKQACQYQILNITIWLCFEDPEQLLINKINSYKIKGFDQSAKSY